MAYSRDIPFWSETLVYIEHQIKIQSLYTLEKDTYMQTKNKRSKCSNDPYLLCYYQTSLQSSTLHNQPSCKLWQLYATVNLNESQHHLKSYGSVLFNGNKQHTKYKRNLLMTIQKKKKKQANNSVSSSFFLMKASQWGISFEQKLCNTKQWWFSMNLRVLTTYFSLPELNENFMWEWPKKQQKNNWHLHKPAT